MGLPQAAPSAAGMFPVEWTERCPSPQRSHPGPQNLQMWNMSPGVAAGTLQV